MTKFFPSATALYTGMRVCLSHEYVEGGTHVNHLYLYMVLKRGPECRSAHGSTPLLLALVAPVRWTFLCFRDCLCRSLSAFPIELFQMTEPLRSSLPFRTVPAIRRG